MKLLSPCFCSLLQKQGTVAKEGKAVITIKNLNKQFFHHKIIEDLNLNIGFGEITALVGKNGAGKSTLIRLISGILNADSGSISTCGSEKISALMGGDVNLYSNLSGKEIIFFFGQMQGVSKENITKQIDSLNTFLDFKKFYNNKIYTYSRGMRQKIAFAVCLINNPEILLLDEPSTGLDIEAANDVIELIKYLKKEKKTIIIATHNIYEICDLSDSVAVLNYGKIVLHEETDKIFKNCDSKSKNNLLLQLMSLEEK